MSPPAPQAVPVAILVHLAAALPALALVPVQALRPKGDACHRRLGRLWLGCMGVSVASSFFIFTDGTPSWIHGLSAWIAVSMLLGTRRARQGRIGAHRAWMGGSAAGLLIAFAFTLAPGRLMHAWLLG